MLSKCEPNPWKGMVCGLLGSFAGLVAMRIYWQHVAPALASQISERQNGEGDNNAPQALDDISLVGKQYQEDESSTAAIGRVVYQQLTGHEPKTQETRTALSYLVHWAYGVVQGGLYGAARSSASNLDLAGGAAFGAGLWLVGDEMIVPLLGFQGGPTAASPVQHANRLGAHLAYGLTTAAATQLLRRLL